MEQTDVLDEDFSDGHAVAFGSPVEGVTQVFLMLTSGGESLQLTNDEGDKYVHSFSSDGKEIYYNRTGNEIWAVPTLGGAPHHVAFGWMAVPSPDGAFVYYVKQLAGIYRSEKSGLNEEFVYKGEGTGLTSSQSWFSPVAMSCSLLALRPAIQANAAFTK